MMRGRAVMAASQPPALAPQLDRSMAILWLGGVLIAANFFLQNPQLKAAAFQKGGEAAASQVGEGLNDLILQAGGVGLLYLVSRISDLGGTAAVMFLVAIWVVFIWRHAAGLESFIGASGATVGGVPSSTSSSGK